MHEGISVYITDAMVNAAVWHGAVPEPDATSDGGQQRLIRAGKHNRIAIIKTVLIVAPHRYADTGSTPHQVVVVFAQGDCGNAWISGIEQPKDVRSRA